MTLITQCAHCGERLEAEFFDEEKWKLEVALEVPIFEEEFECNNCKQTTIIEVYASGYKKRSNLTR